MPANHVKPIELARFGKAAGAEFQPFDGQWFFSALAEAELPVVCVEMRHMREVLQAQINKTNRNDARGIAQMLRPAPRWLAHPFDVDCADHKFSLYGEVKNGRTL